MLEIEGKRMEGVYSEDSLAVGAARVGSSEQRMVCGTLKEMSTANLGPPLHSLVLLGRRTHELEMDYIRDWAIDAATFDASWVKYHGKSD